MGENSGSERQADARLQNTSGSDNIFGDMINSMHQSMQEMMKGFMGAASSGQDHTEQRNEDGKIVHGGGELVVIKSGPGFHEEKKYMLGPDADIEKILDSNMNDMLILDGIETSSELSSFEKDLMREIDLPGIAENIQPPPSPV